MVLGGLSIVLPLRGLPRTERSFHCFAPKSLCVYKALTQLPSLKHTAHRGLAVLEADFLGVGWIGCGLGTQIAGILIGCCFSLRKIMRDFYKNMTVATRAVRAQRAKPKDPTYTRYKNKKTPTHMHLQGRVRAHFLAVAAAKRTCRWPQCAG